MSQSDMSSGSWDSGPNSGGGDSGSSGGPESSSQSVSGYYDSFSVSSGGEGSGSMDSGGSSLSSGSDSSSGSGVISPDSSESHLPYWLWLIVLLACLTFCSGPSGLLGRKKTA